MTFQQEEQGRVVTAEEKDSLFKSVSEYVNSPYYQRPSNFDQQTTDIFEATDTPMSTTTAMKMKDTISVWTDLILLLIVPVLNVAFRLWDRTIAVVSGTATRLVLGIATLLWNLPGILIELVLGEERVERIGDFVEDMQFAISNHWVTKSLFGDDYLLDEEVDVADFIDRVDFISHVRYERVELDR